MANPKIRLNFETAVSFTNNQPVLIETAILPYINRHLEDINRRFEEGAR